MVSQGFVDEAQVNARGGDGGAGVVSFRREAHVPQGGPDGGNGGAGGDVILQADRNVASLLGFRDHPHRRAESGAHGQGSKRNGARGADLVVSVPVGTTVNGRDGQVLADLVRHGDQYVAAHGGRGGRGNASFATNRRRAPGFAEQGEYGEEEWLTLELRLMADVALVGFPNAGKSTLIGAVSAAKPKIADYPFTTLVPHLGVVRFHEHEFVMADIPGLIEGASQGRGLGHQFLRHVERARVLVLLVDLASVEGRSPTDQTEVLIEELSRYRAELLERPRLVVGSKADVSAPEVAAGFEGLTVSAVTRAGLDELLGRLAEEVSAARAAEPELESFVVHRPEGEGFAVTRDDDGAWRVVGRQAERAVAMADLTNDEAAAYVQGRLRRMGVERALAREGVRPGDTVRIGGVEMQYLADSLEGEDQGPERPRRAGDQGPERPRRAGDQGPERPRRAGDASR
ncbi:MAG: GTPase ObgE [Actinobacteria bacterium]|nr:GTPase ObgE [Actinomycetota bacterium]